jgi:ATP-binding cassette, subfamily B, multidrug efflux pump
VSFFQVTKTGDLMSRFTGDINSVQEMLGFGAIHSVHTVAWVVMSFIFMFRLSPALTAVALVAFPLAAAFLFFMLRVIARRYTLVQEQQSVVSARAQESFFGIRVIKSSASEEREVAAFQRLNDEYRRRVLSLARIEGPLGATVGFLVNLAFVAVLWVGAYAVRITGGWEGLSMGGFVAFTTYLFQLWWPMLAVGMVANAVQRGWVSFGRLHEILARSSALPEGKANLAPSSSPASLTFENISIVLGGKTFLDRVSLEIAPGRAVALTGPTGAGKTLLISLATRLLDPTQGRVLVDGQDIRTVSLSDLRAQLGVANQEPFLFSTTLAENIGFGLPERLHPQSSAPLDGDRIRWAGAVSALQSDVDRFHHGYDTILGERGVTLSGGQRQRTALARAVARQPRLLLLDDTLSAVDTETETHILSALGALKGRCTLLLVSHRVSTLRHADEVVVLDQGRVVERGSHEELLARGGHYSTLERQQRLNTDLDVAS